MRLGGERSITFRLTLLFATVSAAVLLLLGFLIGNSVERHFEEQDMEVLTGKLRLTQHALEKVRSEADLELVPERLDDSLVGHSGLAILVIAPAGKTLFASHGADFPPALLERGAQDPAAERLAPMVRRTGTALPLRGIAAAARTGIAGAPSAVVAVAIDISHHEHFMAAFRTTLWSFVVLAAALSGFLGWVVVRRGLAPLQAIKRQAAGITAQRLDARLAAAAVPVELAELARTLNEMLARLEDSFRRLSDFSSDLAHELRTPVSNLLTQTQVTLAKDRSLDEYRDVLASNAEEFEHLARMIADMLYLAKADNGLIVPNRESFDLGAEVERLLEFYVVLTEEKDLAVRSSGSGVVFGDRLMLRRAISNLLANAIRHAPAGGWLAVQVDASDPTLITLAVENSGATIPQEHLARLFDRFYRVDASRQNLGDGAGLGLAITRSIARAHGGEVRVSSQHGRTRFELQLPAARAKGDRPLDLA
ncbi:MAG TPA: heavy metal sensor histidine kinase [Accumulibacter sp.]|nr:heavy metal sensor histidine kinase [Accumulibacter sp.]